MAKPGELTGKQQRFVEEYMIDMNASQAALRAGYSKKTAKQIGTENLAKPAIASAIASATAARTARSEITQAYVLDTIKETVERCKTDADYNPQAALKGLELLGRHMAMFTDKTINKTTVEAMTDEQITARLAELDKPKLTIVS